MSETKIKVPDGMLKVSLGAWGHSFESDPQSVILTKILEAALLWLSENPIVPTMEQAHEIFMLKAGFDFDLHEWVRWGACEWQRRMFLAPEAEIPDAIKDKLWEPLVETPLNSSITLGIAKDHDDDLVEAYRRGQKAGRDV